MFGVEILSLTPNFDYPILVEIYSMFNDFVKAFSSKLKSTSFDKFFETAYIFLKYYALDYHSALITFHMNLQNPSKKPYEMKEYASEA